MSETEGNFASQELVELLNALAAGLVTAEEARTYTKRIRPEWYSDE